MKHALTRHDATLEIRSTPGAGSRFIARFPAERVAPSLEPPSALDESSARREPSVPAENATLGA